MTNPTAKSLTLDLLSTLRGGSMPVRALVEAARFFAIEENNVRVSLARLRAADVIERDQRGRYRLAASSAAVERQITSWRRLEERVCSWDGGWLAVHGNPPTRGAAGRRCGQALRLLGFRCLEPGLMLRPDNLKGGVTGVRRDLSTLGFDQRAAVFAIQGLDAQREQSARELWDTRELLDRYAECLAELVTSRSRLSSLPPEEAMIESFLLGGAALRRLVLDPLLPDAILPTGPRNKLVAEMRDYDRIGRAAWADFLQGHGVIQQQAPADLRMGHPESRFNNVSNTGAPA